MEGGAPSSSTAPARGRGRGKSRGGLGKYLRARGRGGGRGRGAVWGERLLLDGEKPEEMDEEEQEELRSKFARRQLGTNADRYEEPEPELGSDGEQIVEPEVDLSAFLERQRLSPQPSSQPPPEEDLDIDTSLAHILPGRQGAGAPTKKGKVQQIEWDASLERIRREKAAAEAKWDLKSRFRASAATQRGTPSSRGRGFGRGKQQDRNYVEAPPLPSEEKPEKPEKEGMQDFLDDLLG